MDNTDKKILSLMQENGRISNAEIARTIGLAPSAIHERIKKLESRDLIVKYRTVVDRERLGYKLLAYVFISTDESALEMDIANRISEFPEVLEMHIIAGEHGFLAKMVFEDARTMSVSLREKFNAIGAKVRTHSIIVLETLKEDSMIPIPVD